MGRYSNRPADGFHSSPFAHRHTPFEPFLIAVAALFLMVAVAPASVIGDTAGTGIFGSQDLFTGTAGVAGVWPDIEPASGITADSLSEHTPEPAFSDDTPDLSIVSRLATLLTSRGVWLVAFTPWICSFLVWHVRPPVRRRSRRHQY